MLMFLWATAFLAVTYGVNRYIWSRLIDRVVTSVPWRRGLTFAFLVLAFSIPVSALLVRWVPRAVAGPLSFLAFCWMGLSLYLLLFLVLGDLGATAFRWFRRRLVAGAFGGSAAGHLQDSQRRLLLRRLFVGSAVTASSGIAGYGAVEAARGFQVKRVRVPVQRMPPHGDGYKIVQLTDVHIGPTLGRDFMAAVVARTNALSPDAIVITGDLVDGTVEQLREHVAPLADLRAPHGVYFVTGNHEYYWGADAWVNHLASLGVRVLRNELVNLGDVVQLAGVDDLSAKRMLPGHDQDVKGALQSRLMGRPVVLLAHQPRAFKEARRLGVDLQLSGHTHAGQMRPFDLFVRLVEPFVAGLHRIDDSYLYVSSGTGYWGPPMRVGTEAEITLIQLHAIQDTLATAET